MHSICTLVLNLVEHKFLYIIISLISEVSLHLRVNSPFFNLCKYIQIFFPPHECFMADVTYSASLTSH